MSKTKQSTIAGPMGRRLGTEKFHRLAATLQEWRIDPFMQQMEATRDKGRVLGFVKGLRLSSQLAYIIRDIVSGHNVQVSWGHLVDDSGTLCSPECDIIIHRPGYFQRWNGDGGPEPIMDFRFIECSKALAVVSCKSSPAPIDKKYCGSFAEYGMNNIVLFSEWCESEIAQKTTDQVLAAGYTGFYYLYRLAKDDFTIEQDPEVYVAFIETIKAVVED